MILIQLKLEQGWPGSQEHRLWSQVTRVQILMLELTGSVALAMGP